MTDDNDRVAYLAGEEGVEVDDVTRADLDELMSLLGDETVWAEPGDQLEDAVVAAITAEAVRTPTGEAPAEVTAPRAARRKRTFSGTRAALTAAAAVAALAAVGYVVSRGGDETAAEVDLEGTDLSVGASGSARLTQTDSGWRIELDATGLPRLDDGRFYQAWLKNDDDVLIAIGTFNEPDEVVLWAGVPPSVFSTLTVTEEEADGDPASSGRRVLVGTIVSTPNAQARLAAKLLASTPEFAAAASQQRSPAWQLTRQRPRH